MAKAPVCFQLKVILNHIKPSIWRRILVPGNLTVRQLHTILQVVMEWQESHLHMFKIQDKEYGDPQDDETGRHAILDEHNYRLDRIIPKQVGFRFTYTYDFGDGWEHVLLVEKVLPPEEGADRRPVCLAGQRASALEDSGGPYGYMELLEAFQNPSNPENAERLEWAGEEFDPQAFNLDEINQRLNLLVDSDYQLEELFDFDEDELDILGEVDNNSEGMLASFDNFAQVFSKWMLTLPQDQQQTCENLRIRKDYLTFLTYLRDNKVKGTASTGNLTLKAVREINASFVFPQPMELEGHKVRSEEQMPDLLFMHAMAYARELIDGGPQEYWELTKEGEMFLEMPPAIQVLDMFLSWLLHMQWTLTEYLDTSEDQEIEVRMASIWHIAQMPNDTWIGIVPLSEQIAETSSRKVDEAIGEIPGREFWKMAVFTQLVMPMLLFEIFEGRKGADMDSFEFRLTPLGSSLLNASLEILK